MNFLSPSSFPQQKQAFLIFAGFIGVLAVCLMLPRALSFLPALFGCGTLVFLMAKNSLRPILDKPLGIFLFCVVALSALSAFWAMDSAFALERAGKTSGVFLSCYALMLAARSIPFAHDPKNALPCAVFSMCALGAILIICEYATGFKISSFLLGVENPSDMASIQSGYILNRSLVFLVLLCIPALFMINFSSLVLRTKKILIGILLLLMAIVLYQAHSQTAQLAAIVALLMVFFPSHKRLARRVLAASILVVIVILPVVIKPLQNFYLNSDLDRTHARIMYEASIGHRLEVWNFISDKIHEKPFFGHGTEATRFLKSDAMMEKMHSQTVLHPHNFFLQVWIEFGLLGICLLVAFLLYLFKRLDLQPPLRQRYYATLLIAVLCVLNTGYGMWQAWQIGMIFTLAAFSAMIIRQYAPASQNG